MSGERRHLKKLAIIVAFVICCTVLVLSGCGGESSSGGGSSATHKIAMIHDGSINDGGWGSSCYSAMTEAASDLGWETAVSENVAAADWSTVLQNYADQGYDLIFAPGEQYNDAVKQVAAENPDAKFVVLESDLTSDNIESLQPNTAQIGKLAGVLAGLLSKTGSVGFIGGTELNSTKEKLQGFTDGAKAVYPGIQVTSAYAGSFTDAAKGKEIAGSMIASNAVDVLFGDASVVDTGAREAVSAHEGVLDIGQPGDLGSADDDVIACSVVTDDKTMLEQSMKNVADGSFGGKIIEGNLSNGGVRVGTFSNKLVSADVQERFNAYVDQIKNGEL